MQRTMQLRLDSELEAPLERRAKAENRSLNNCANTILRNALLGQRPGIVEPAAAAGGGRRAPLLKGKGKIL